MYWKAGIAAFGDDYIKYNYNYYEITNHLINGKFEAHVTIKSHLATTEAEFLEWYEKHKQL